MNKQLKIASRSSALALAQVNEIIAQLPNIDTEIIKVSTEVGDVNLKDPLYQMQSIGVFTKGVEQYLLDKKAQVAVHSLKDLPTIIHDDLIIAAYTKFQERGDVVILQKKYAFKNMNELPHGFKLGTSSLRRITSIRNIYPNLILENIRGNLNTRLQKLDEGLYDGIILAKAGVLRLGLQDRITFDLEEEQFMYAPGQASLAIQCRKDDKETYEILRAINDKEAEMRCIAERMFLNLLEGGCKLPIAVYSRFVGDNKVFLRGRIISQDGKKVVEGEHEGEYDKVGSIVNEIVRGKGGKELM